mmetsp:Transcript_22957/g.35224  ORF Transcript_22957/g.35224 Transcript_22957/m.35224 type:complete len:192 (-) Transcript_22957:297-872(-)
MNTTKLEETKIESKDDNDFPFVLCTPTKLDDNDEVDAQDSMFDEDESPRLMNFFLKPRPSCKCPTGCHHEQNDMCTDSALNDMAEDSAKEHILERNLPSQHQQFTPRSSSPVPTLQTFDVMVTPPVINLLKRRRRPSQDELQEEKDQGDDSDSSPSKMCPLFPSLGRQPHQQQPQHQQLPVLRRPLARRLR